MKKEIIERFLKGDSSEREREAVVHWLVSQANEHEVNASLKGHWETVEKGEPIVDVDLKAIFKKLVNKIEEEKVIQLLKQKATYPNKSKSVKWPASFKYAAAAILIIATGLFFAVIKTQRVTIQEQVLVVKENQRGTNSKIQLPDGSVVWLNAESKISYLPDFSPEKRVIKLQGEAYFEVVKDANRPFSVVSGQIVTTALGTSFNVNAYRKQNVIVSLSTGKVDVKRKDSDKQVILYPGEQVIASVNDLQVNPFDRKKILAWKEGTIYFEDTDLDEMISQLEKWYDVTILIENLSSEQRKELKGNGKFTHQALSDVLELLSHSMNFKYTIENKKVTIKFEAI